VDAAVTPILNSPTVVSIQGSDGLRMVVRPHTQQRRIPYGSRRDQGHPPRHGPGQPAHRRVLPLPAWLILVCIMTFSVLLWAGTVIAREAPPIPLVIEPPQHRVILDRRDIQAGQTAYLSRAARTSAASRAIGSYLAPGWTADVLHRLGLATAGVLRNQNPDFD